MQKARCKFVINSSLVMGFIFCALKNAVLIIIGAYRIFISPLLGRVCIYEVSCSKYSMKVFKEETFTKALILSTKRILSCHPWNRDNMY